MRILIQNLTRLLAVIDPHGEDVKHASAASYARFHAANTLVVVNFPAHALTASRRQTFQYYECGATLFSIIDARL